MANGFFLGGMADSMQSMREQDLKERTLAQDTGLRTRALDIQEANAKRTAGQQLLEQVDKQVSDTMTTVSEVIKAAAAGGRDLNKVRSTVAPLVESAKRLYARSGRDPSILDAKLDAWLTQPNAIEAAAVEGRASAAKKVAEDAALNSVPGYNPEAIRDPSKKAETENALRDDYLRQSDPFIKIRDAKSRMDSIDITDQGATGAGDMGLVFTYMKVLDPGSTVREGEYATAANAAGVPSSVMALYNKMVGGGQLDAKGRREIKEQAEKFYNRAAQQHDKLTTQFAENAKRKGLNVRAAVPDLLPPSPSFGDRFQGATPSGTRFRVLQ